MLVVCGDDLIIFSDKAIKYQEDKPVNIAWPRFYRKAIKGAVDQINGAYNWISRYPDKIFTDPACTQRLPIDLPNGSSARFHGVVVATGAHRAVQRIMNDDSGSFIVAPWLKGDDAIDTDHPNFLPFCIGDVNPDGMFIHVFDDVTIKRVLNHLDTIADFTRYLDKRAKYLRSGKLMVAHGEEELLAGYLQVGIMRNGEYDFEPPRKKTTEKFALMTTQGGWSSYLRSEQYFSKTIADDKSRFWDRLIGLFTSNVVAGTSVAILGEAPSASLSERGLRFMALENRFARRMLSAALEGAIVAARTARQDRFVRTIMPTQVSANPKLAYVFMILAYPTDLARSGGLPGGYDQYRKARANMLEAYCLNVLRQNPQLNTAVGIAVDAHSSQTGRPGGSEDLMVVQIDEWDEELIATAADARERFDVLREERLVMSHLSDREFPVSEMDHRPRMNRARHRLSRERFKKKRK